MLLAGSRRCRGCSYRWAGPRPRRGLGPRPIPICFPYPATRPHHSTGKLSPVCATGNLERMGEKRRKSLQNACVPPEFQQDVEKKKTKRKRKRGKLWMSLTLLCAGRSPIHRDPRTPAASEPPVKLEPMSRLFAKAQLSQTHHTYKDGALQAGTGLDLRPRTGGDDFRRCDMIPRPSILGCEQSGLSFYLKILVILMLLLLY